MDPVRFVFGVHFHPPVGNFGQVFEDHLRDVYLPLVERLTERRYTSRRWSSKTWSKFPTGWWKCTPNTNRTGSIRWAHRGTAPLSRLADTAPARSRPPDRCSAPGRGAPADPLRGWRRPFRRDRSRP